MATTRLIPLHVGKGKTIRSALGRTVDYVENPNKTNEGEYISSYECDPLIAQQQFLFTKSQYVNHTGRNQGDSDVIAYHLRQSFKPDEVDPEKANKIGYDLAMSLTKGKHAFVVCTHVDKHHIHSHIVFNSTSLNYDKKFRNFWGSSFAIRKISDRLCLENHLSIVENPKLSKGNYTTWLGEKPKTFSDKLRLAIDEILATKPTSFEDFLQQMQAENFEVKHGKYIAFKGDGQQKFIRLKSLGDEYTEEKIRDVIDGKSIHISKNKVSLLVNIQAKLDEGKGKEYEQWAKIYNLKQMAQTMNFLRENSLLSYKNLEEKSSKLTTEFNDLNTKIKSAEKRLSEMKVLENHIYNYARTRKIYKAYRLSGYSKKYYFEHESELLTHKACKKYFDEIGIDTLPSIRSLQMEYSRLLAQKKTDYIEYKNVKKDMQNILNAKANIDKILGLDTKKKSKTKDKNGLDF